MLQKQDFKKGLLHGIPIALGYSSVSFAFGIFAVESGLTPLQVLLISMTCVTSAGQLAAVPIIAACGGLLELAMSQLIINLRYSLMSVSLSQKLDPTVKTLDRFLVAFMNTDEIFAVASGQPGKVSKYYLCGLILLPWIGWSCGTIFGAMAGNVLPAVVTVSLGVAIYGMFIAIVVPEAKRSRPTALCVLFSLILSCVFYYTPVLNQISGGFVIIICSILASVVFAIAYPIKKGDASGEN